MIQWDILHQPISHVYQRDDFLRSSVLLQLDSYFKILICVSLSQGASGTKVDQYSSSDHIDSVFLPSFSTSDSVSVYFGDLRTK